MRAGFSRPDSNRSDSSRADDGFRPWHFFVLGSILLATVAVVLTRQSTPENLILLSFTIGAAGLTASALYRMLLPLASRDIPMSDQPLTDRHRATLERDKVLTLRAIKELEFDRAMGKLAPKDFEELTGKLRLRALSLMKQLEGTASYAAVVEKDLQARLGAAATGGAVAAEATAVRARCVCGARNDDDAVFCKKCGSRLAA